MYRGPPCRSSSTRSPPCIATRRRRRAASVSTGSGRSRRSARRPGDRRELIQLYARLLARLGVHRVELRLNSIGDAVCRPAYVEALEAWLDAHDALLDEEARLKTAHEPAAGVRRLRIRCCRRRSPGAPDRRGPLRSPAASISTRSPATSTHSVFPTRSIRRSCAGSTTTRAHLRVRPHRARADDLRRGPLRRAGRADRRAADPRDRLRRRYRPAQAGGRIGGADRAAGGLDVFIVLDGAAKPADRRVARRAARVRLACDIDYAGRSLKGQVTQATRSGARTVVFRPRGGRDRSSCRTNRTSSCP